MTVIRPQDLLAKLEALQARVKVLETNNRLSSATLRKVAIVNDDGTTIGFVGGFGASLNLPDGSPQAGFVFSRADGTAAFTIFDPDPVADGFNQFWAMWDREQQIVVADDAISGSGLDKPYVDFTMANTDQATWPGPTTTSFADMFLGYTQKWHPYVEVWAQVSVAASTTAEVQLTQGDTVIGEPIEVIGSTLELVSWQAPVDGGIGTLLDLHVAARRSVGVGAVKVQVFGAWGRGTP